MLNFFPVVPEAVHSPVMTTATTRHPGPLASPDTSHGRAGGVPRLFWMLWTGILINRLGTMVEPFLGVYLVAVRGFPVSAAGGVLAVYALGSMVSQILGGMLADTLGRRATMTLGMLANGTSLIALGYVTAAPAVIAMTFAAGATIDIYRPAAQALVADLIPAAGRARAYGLISWAANLGFSAAMLSGGLLAQAGFQWLFWADALTCAAFAALAWRAMPGTQTRSRSGGTEHGGFGDVLRARVMAGFTLVVLGYTAVYQQAFTTLPIAMYAGGLSPRAYGLVMAVNGIVIVIAWPLAGRPRPQPGHRGRQRADRHRVRRHCPGLLRPGLRRRRVHLDARRDRHGRGQRRHHRRPGLGSLARPVPGALWRRLVARRAARPAGHPAPAPRGARALAYLRRGRRRGGARPARPRASHPQPRRAQRPETA